MAADRDQRIVSATFFASQVDFTHSGDLRVFIDEEQIAALMTTNAFLRDFACKVLMAREPGLAVFAGILRYLAQRDRHPDDLRAWGSKHHEAGHHGAPQVQSFYGVTELPAVEGFKFRTLLIGQWHHTPCTPLIDTH
jgi:hypothetical protein